MSDEKDVKTQALEKLVVNLKSSIDDLRERVEVLEKVSPIPATPKKAVPKPTIPAKPFVVDGKKYMLKFAAFRIDGERYTSDDVMKDKTLQAMLVENKVFTIIEEVNK